MSEQTSIVSGKPDRRWNARDIALGVALVASLASLRLGRKNSSAIKRMLKIEENMIEVADRTLDLIAAA